MVKNLFKILHELLTLVCRGGVVVVVAMLCVVCVLNNEQKYNNISNKHLISKANLYDELNGGEKCSEADTQTL